MTSAFWRSFTSFLAMATSDSAWTAREMSCSLCDLRNSTSVFNSSDSFLFFALHVAELDLDIFLFLRSLSLGP